MSARRASQTQKKPRTTPELLKVTTSKDQDFVRDKSLAAEVIVETDTGDVLAERRAGREIELRFGPYMDLGSQSVTAIPTPGELTASSRIAA
jgi:hypothetical protein